MRELAILCVDDEEIILQAITQEIETIVGDDIIIESALSADEAIEVCEELEEDGVELALVISDCIMPGLQGDKLLEAIHQKYPNTYKVMLTGQAEIGAIKYAINNANLYRYLTKPWDAEDMALTVQSALKGFNDAYELESYRKDLEEKVKVRTKELKKAIDLVHEYALYTKIDKDGTIVESSNSFAELCGVSKEELEGKTIYDTISNDSCENCIEKIKIALLENKEYQTEIKQQYLPEKATWVDMQITPIQNEEYFSVKRYDVTDKKCIQELCDIDVLTSLYNRRFFNSIMPKEIQRVKRDKNSLVFMMLDVDNFKKYNDTYGHQMGDRALVSVASVLKDVTKRGSDFAFRLGGEEFGILTSSMSLEEAVALGDLINKKLFDLKVEHSKNDASPYLSSSIGLVYYDDGEVDDIDTIMKLSDEMLYEAKENGRNQVKYLKR